MVDFSKIEEKWQKSWKEKKIFEVKEDSKKKKYYVLEMYPYPSASGLHMGHLRNYAIGDCFARYKRMNGFNVIYPMGYDAFGLPAENAAIKNNADPEEWTLKNIENIKKQQNRMGLSYDWTRQVQSCDTNYYKWNQWIFLKFLEKGLAYRKCSYVNFCPKCDTVLANEQVVSGKCWRCSTEVQQKALEQWFFRIRDYAEELLNNLESLDWPEQVKIMQRNWIGKSEGTIINFKIKKTNEEISIFTTRIDTIYGVTFVVFAPEHPLVRGWVKGTKYEDEFNKFFEDVMKEDRFERTSEESEKKGMFIGKYAINPLTNEEVPVYVGNFVVYEYGAGAVMAVPAHDQRDFEFAKKFKIPIKIVIQPDAYNIDEKKMAGAYIEDGHLVNSKEFNGINNREAIEGISKKLEKEDKGGKTVNYKLRDWLISRQRYWGTPIPVVYCKKCGTVPVPEKELPVKLPKDVQFGKGNPLETSKSFINTKCPKCSGKAKRETDTMDTFVDSSWYFLRYCSPKSEKSPFEIKSVNYWMPVDQYIGGIEHAVMHLLYARFFTKALRDLKMLDFDEPFAKLLCQGMVIKDGAKMSKSLGNVVDPLEIISKYGADTARLFILFTALPEKELEWSDQGVAGAFRFVNRLYFLIEEKAESKEDDKLTNRDKHIISKMHETIKKVTELIDEFKLSLAIGTLMEFISSVYRYKDEKVNKKAYNGIMKNLVLMSAPFMPHIAEEMWAKLKQKEFISLAKWPVYDEKKIDHEAIASEELVQKAVLDIRNVLELIKMEAPKHITLIIADEWKYLFMEILKQEIEKTRDIKLIMTACMGEKDLKRYGSEISRLVPSLLKDTTRIPITLLDMKTELALLKDAKEMIEKEFGCKIEIIKAEDSMEAKARNALPGKPAIVVE